MNPLSRRGACACLASSAFLLGAPTSAKVRPFCLFSTRKGWSNASREFITRKAGTNDKSGVPQVISKILGSLSIHPDMDVFIAEREDNSFASVAGGIKIIVVDVRFVRNINKIAKTDWAAIQIISHEVSHHIAGFSESPHKSELNADYWSGQAVQRLGASREASTKAILAVGSEADTASHPSKHRRAPVMEKGWDDAKGGTIDHAFCESCK